MPRAPQTSEANPKTFLRWLKAQGPAQQHAYAQLKHLAGKPMEERDLIWWLAVGRQVRTLYPEDEKRRYGKRFMPALAAALFKQEGKNRQGLLYRARVLAGQYDNKDLGRIEGQRKGTITLRHLVHLLGEKKAEARKRLLKRCVRNGWSSDRLKQEVRASRGGWQAGGGRDLKPTFPQEVSVAVRELKLVSRRWQAYAEHFLEGARDKPLGPKEQKHARLLRKEVGESLTLLKGMGKSLRELQAWFGELETQLETLDSKGQADKPAGR